MIKAYVTEMPDNCRACPFSQGMVCNLTQKTDYLACHSRSDACPLVVLDFIHMPLPADVQLANPNVKSALMIAVKGVAVNEQGTHTGRG